MVGVARFELATPAMSMQCSTAELYAHSDAASSETASSIQASIEPAGTFLIKHPFNLKHQILQMERFRQHFGVGHGLACAQCDA
jgi:hypothetical protein